MMALFYKEYLAKLGGASDPASYAVEDLPAGLKKFARVEE
jgi:hypothetical protein